LRLQELLPHQQWLQEPRQPQRLQELRLKLLQLSPQQLQAQELQELQRSRQLGLLLAEPLYLSRLLQLCCLLQLRQ